MWQNVGPTYSGAGLASLARRGTTSLILRVSGSIEKLGGRR